MPPLPAQGDTSWMDWATGVHSAATEVVSGRLTAAALAAAIGSGGGTTTGTTHPLPRWQAKLTNSASTAKIAFLGDSTSAVGFQEIPQIKTQLTDAHTVTGGDLAGVQAANIQLYGLAGHQANGYWAETSIGGPVTTFAPDLIIYSMGINDARFGATTATLVSRIVTEIDLIRAALPNADIVLRVPNSITTDGGDGSISAALAQTMTDTVRNAYLQLVGRWDNCRVFNAQDRIFGRISRPFVTGGLWFDQIHPSGRAVRAIADGIVEELIGLRAAYSGGTVTEAPTTPALTNTVTPAITGTATTGQTLTVSNGTWSATPDSYTRQWKRAGVNISGATGSTYVLQVADEGQAITCTVTAVKSGYTSASATSASVTPTSGATPALTNTVAPAITGTATTGSVLTVSDGTWSATPDSFTRQWKRAGANISGATATTYTLVQADEAQAITCTVTAVKAGYTSASATSNSVTPAAAGGGGSTDVGPALTAASPTYGTGKFGQALKTGTLTTTAGFAGIRTMECWVKVDPTNVETRVAIGTGNSPVQFWIGVTGLAPFWGSAAGANTGGADMNDNAWHHLAVTIDATAGLRCWRDGALVRSDAAITAAITIPAATGFGIGLQGQSGSFPWANAGGTNLIDEVRLSSVARYSAAFTPSATALTTDGNTLALYHLDS